ncbi:MAG: DUF1570 domain-containing protein [Deltaproteobacteria bacterium]
MRAVVAVLGTLAALLAPGFASPLRGDVFVYKDATGETVEVEARLVATGRGFTVLETADGQYRFVPDEAVEKRKVKEGPAPLDCGAMVARLQKQFGEDLFRGYSREPFVIGLVLASRLPKSSEIRAKNFLTKAATFMKGVEGAFVSFVKEARINTQKPAHPLVVLIFETQDDFNRYANSITGGNGLSANRIAGFYSGTTNFLAIRMAECRSFDVPLHEAIHQQVYNRRVFERLAPIPHWFDEGIATGFEATQGRISVGPSKISPRYARQVIAAKNLTFREIVADDRVFAGDVLASEAYGNAWALHWLLFTKYRIPYGKYLRTLSEKQPLEKEDPDQRLADFKQAFGKELAEIEREFPGFLETGIKKQNVDLNPERPPGISFTQQNVGEVEVTGIRKGNQIFVEGQLSNISPLRPMSFHVTVETDGGTYADWHVANLDIGKTAPLARQYATKTMRGVRTSGVASTFRVRIRSAIPDSEEATLWRKGELPVPAVSE